MTKAPANGAELPRLAASPRTFGTRVDIIEADAIAFLRSLARESIDLIVTDPAYSGMNDHLKLGRGRIVGSYKDRGESGKWFSEFRDTRDNYAGFLEECARVLRPNSHLFIMFDAFSMLTLAPIVRDFFDVKNVIVWDKMNLGMGHHFRRQSEFVLFASKGRRPLSRRDMPDVWRICRLPRAEYPTQKPTELFEYMIAVSRTPGKSLLVCDPFVGSGSSAIAAMRQGCGFVGCDSSPRAVGVARTRIETFRRDGHDPLQPHSALSALQKKFI
jgi:site-specific DNA-methyltransferase (adenine-specific)